MSLELELDYRLRWLDFDRSGRINPVHIDESLMKWLLLDGVAQGFHLLSDI